MNPATPSNFRIGAYGLLIEEGRLLLTRTRTRLGAVWNLPGGALELGEGALEALQREFIEETGLEIRPLALAHASERYHRSEAYPENQLIKLYWFVERLSGQLRLEGNGDDVEACNFVKIDQLLAIGLTSPDEEAIQSLQRRGLLSSEASSRNDAERSLQR